MRELSRLLWFVATIAITICGRITEEKLLWRYQEENGEIDSDGRPRRQLPTEINIQVTAPLFTARLYDYGTSDGDKQVPPSVDVGMRLELSHPIRFFGNTYKEVYVLSNGGIGFEQNSRNYKSNILKTGPPLIAPLWNRNDLRKGGQIFYREVTEGRPIERAQSEVRYQYDRNIKPISVMIITWVNMQPNGEQTVSNDNANTIQAAIINTENETYANLIFKHIGWSQGAEAGFSKGDGQHFYTMPSSGTDNIMYLKDYGNTGIPGEWIFEIGRDKIIRCKSGIKGDTCDDECAEFEWGPDCGNCCKCAKGKCNAASGECPGKECKQCWSGSPYCDKREADCKVKPKDCGFNAISFTDFDHCGEPVVRCQCLAGYVGDGFNCSDVDECAKKQVCHEHANCINTPGRYYCQCLQGYTGNGTVCTQVEKTTEEVTEATTKALNKKPVKKPVEKPNEVSTEPAKTPKISTKTTKVIDLSTEKPKAIEVSATQPRAIEVSTEFPDSFEVYPDPRLVNISVSRIDEDLLPTDFELEPVFDAFHANMTVNVTVINSLVEASSNSSENGSAATVISNNSHESTSKAHRPEVVRTIIPELFSPTPERATTNFPATTPPEQARTTTIQSGHQDDQPKSLPKETNAHMVYHLKQPLMLLGKMQNKLSIWSTGVVALDNAEPVNPNNDLVAANVKGFAPFFGNIDIGRGAGKVYIGETSDFEVLSEASNMIENKFHTHDFSAKSVVTISFDNVTSPNGLNQNTFEVVLVGGNNALGENVTFVEYIYSDLQWADDARAMILSDDPASSFVLPGSGSDDVRQLMKKSNVKVPGQWMFKVDSPKVNRCPTDSLVPPFCDFDSSPSTASSIPVNDSTTKVNIVDKKLLSRPDIDFEDNGQTVTFPAFITLVPQLITPGGRGTIDPQFVTPNVFAIQTNHPTSSDKPATATVTFQQTVENLFAATKPSTDKEQVSALLTSNQTIQPQFNATIALTIPPSFVPTTDVSFTEPHFEITSQDLPVSTDQSVSGSSDSDVPPLQIFTSTTRKTTRSPVPTKSLPRLVTASTTAPALDDYKKYGPPPYSAGNSEEQDSLNSPSKLAIIIPTAIVGVWLLLLIVIGIVVCCRRRNTRKRMRSKYDPSYHFRHASHAMPLSRGKEAGVSAQPSNGYPHVSYEDHLDKAARLADVSQYAGQSGRAAIYGSYWNLPSSNRQQYNYYNQGYYDSCPEFGRYNYSGRY